MLRTGLAITTMTAIAWALESVIAIVVILFLLGAWEATDALTEGRS